ncbi:hypothetical protein FQA39_LY16986 [Lamprigera yunnana]|nr:hypothetical protein FQA39_LY16986 [Lamprigera yunnana]
MLQIADAEEQYNKIKGLKKTDVVLLQEWLKKQPHLPPIEELKLIQFLHSCFYSLEKTKVTIDNYYTIKTESPEIFGKKDPVQFNQTINEGVCIPLPQLTSEGYQIHYVKLLECDPYTYIPEQHFKYCYICLFLRLMEIGPVEGVVIVIDMKNVTLAHITRLPLMTVKKCAFFMQEAFPVRLKSIHCINAVSFIDIIMTILKPFLKKELLNLFHFHHKIETLYTYVPLKCLPSDMGGEEKSLSELYEATKRRIADNAKYIEKYEREVVDESKRMEKTHNVKTLFGTEGSFKKLDID